MVKTRSMAGLTLNCSTSAAESSTLSAVKGSGAARGGAPFGDRLSAARAANGLQTPVDGPSDTPAKYAPTASRSPAPRVAIRVWLELIPGFSFASRFPNRLPAGAELVDVRRHGEAGLRRDHCSGGPTTYPDPRIVRIKGTPPATSIFLRRLCTCTSRTLKSEWTLPSQPLWVSRERLTTSPA